MRVRVRVRVRVSDSVRVCSESTVKSLRYSAVPGAYPPYTYMSAAPSGCDEATAAAWPTLALGGSPWVAGSDHAHCVVSSSHS